MDHVLRSRAALSVVPAGAAIWRRLHVMALGWDGRQDSLSTTVTLATNAIPCGSCKAHWLEIIRQKPPICTTADEFFALTVDWHNAVNERIGKPVLSVDDARKLYSTNG